MRRAPIVLAGTIAGAAGVFAFPVAHRFSSTSSTSTTSDVASTSSSSTASGSPGSSAASTTTTVPSTSATARSATGTDVTFQYGDVAVKVTVEGAKVTNVTTASLDETDQRSEQIDSYAVPELEQQVIDADSASIQGVSGATYTSQAFEESLESALSQLGFK